jgi:acetylornithine/succinyldiaminopimelate/putrescine aminotransferase
VPAVLSNNEVLGTLKPGQHGSTFGGNPLACAVARALRVLVEEGMIENAAVQVTRFLDGLRSIRADTIREVRGRGTLTLKVAATDRQLSPARTRTWISIPANIRKPLNLLDDWWAKRASNARPRH